ncbi:MAG TPA: AAA family ATPase [Kofleriaceae bacterium]|jgi:ATP-dependent Clp protease ATP-binding subunit ClpC
MTKPGFRVFVTHHHGGLISAVLLRKHRMLGDAPPPAAMATDVDTALARLAPQAALIVDDEDDDDGINRARYTWTEDLQLHRVEIEIHPGRPDPQNLVVAHAIVPLRIAYAAAKLPGDLWRVLVPRFDWSFSTESLATVPETLRALAFAMLVGDSAAQLYDLRREVDEEVREWRPLDATGRNANREDREPPPPTLEATAEDWTALARENKLPATVGTDPVFDDLAAVIADPKAPFPSLLLVGPRGAGKSALVRRIARAFADQSRGKTGRKRRLWATSADRIVAGMIYLGMWQERCLTLEKELTGTEDVLYVDRLADLLAPMSDGGSIFELLGLGMLRGNVRLVAECDEAELVRARTRAPGLVDGFRIVRVPEATAAQTIALLEPYGQRTDPKIAVTPDAARRLVDLLAAFRRDTAFPGKALAFVNYLATKKLDHVDRNSASPSGDAARSGYAVPFDAPRVTAAFGDWSGLPVDLLSPERALDTAAIAAHLRAGVIGQDAACATAGRVIARLKAGLDDPQRPVGSLLFAGPTGVGKTELAKQLARYLFGDAERLVRVDMSELVTSGAIARLIAPSPSGTSLADRIRRQPLSVVLFDEIEKANAAAFDLLLGVLGDGRLTDALGRLVDFRMAVIVMTTNLGAADPRPAGFSHADGPADPGSAIRKFFRPELLGRVDSIVAFRPLGPDSLARIVELEFAKLRQRPGFAARNLRLELSATARATLARLGYEPALGARPLRRTIEDLVVGPIAERMAADPAWRDAIIRVTGPGEGGDVVVHNS